MSVPLNCWEYNIAMPWATVYIRRALSFLPGGEMVSLRSLVPSLGVRILPRQRFLIMARNSYYSRIEDE